MGLWRHADFIKLWTGQSISLLGSAVTTLALPSVAILALGAKPFQVGLLGALGFAAFPILGLPAGVWVDRLPRRAVMIVADAGRMLALGSVPAAWAVHMLTLAQLYLVAVVVGVLTVFFDVAYQAYLPALIERRDLVEGNTKLEISRSSAEVAGNGVGGVLIQVLGAPLSVLVDALSFAASIVGLALIRRREAWRAGSLSVDTFMQELKDGVAVVTRDPLLRSIAGCTATSNLGNGMVTAVFLLFAYRHLHLAPVLVGGLLAFGNLGIAGAFFAGWFARRLGLGRALLWSSAASGLATLATALAARWAPIPILLGSLLLASLARPVYNVNQVSLRQAIVPDRLQGRMNATMRTIVWGTLPIGSLVGGLLGSTIGIVETIVVAGVVSTVAAAWIRFSSLNALVAVPTLAEGALP